MLSSVLALTLASTLAGCGGNNGSGEGSNMEGGSSGSDLKPVTLTYFSEDSSTNWNNMQDEVGKVIAEKTGVTLDAEFAVGDPVQKCR